MVLLGVTVTEEPLRLPGVHSKVPFEPVAVNVALANSQIGPLLLAVICGGTGTLIVIESVGPVRLQLPLTP